MPTNHSSDGSPESGNGLFKRVGNDIGAEEEDEQVPSNLKDIFKISNRNRKKNKQKKKQKMTKMKSDSGDTIYSILNEQRQIDGNKQGQSGFRKHYHHRSENPMSFVK